MLSLSQAAAAALICALVTFFTRAFPFIIYQNSWSENPSIKFLQRYIPPMTMVILTVYCFKDVSLGAFAIPFISALFTAALHFLLKNPLISIFSGTTLYMVLIRFFN
ncbi:MAG: AzlD domain-containing protein [Deferribacteraceae bacterium]|nr:AzlD domain-containing protein [Deferribacteraceae bacterium]